MLLSAVGRVAGVLLLIVLALVFALGLDPVVRWLIRHGLRRIYGVAVVAGAFLLVLAGVAAAIVPPIVTQIGELVRAAPALIEQLQNRSSVVGRLNARFTSSTP